jgi:dihydrofolate reductase
MRKIINATYITLDGVIEGPHLWPSLGTRDERWEQIQTDLLLSCDGLLMGRRTYDGFAPVWRRGRAIRCPTRSTACQSTWCRRR